MDHELFKAAFTQAPLATLLLSADGQCIAANDALCRALGSTESDLRERGLVTRADPQDRRALSQLSDELRRGARDGFEMRVRYRRGDGAMLWTVTSASLLRDAMGQPCAQVLQLLNAAQQLRAEAAQEARHRELRLFVDNAPVGMVIVNPDYTFRMVNQVYAAMVGRSAATLPGHHVREVVGERVFEELLRPNLETVLSGEEIEMERPWNSQDWGTDQVSNAPRLRMRYVPECDSQGRVIGCLGIIDDVTRSHRSELRLRRQAHHDALTGLLNRWGFDRAVAALRPVAWDEPPHCVCLIDLDGFKRLNDSCGHACGDRVLYELAQVLLHCIRRSDSAVRLGGDELALLLPRCPVERGERIANEALAGAAAIQIGEAAGAEVGVSASAGLAAMRDVGAIDDVLKQADEACYEAKQAGGGRIRVAAAS